MMVIQFGTQPGDARRGTKALKPLEAREIQYCNQFKTSGNATSHFLIPDWLYIQSSEAAGCVSNQVKHCLMEHHEALMNIRLAVFQIKSSAALVKATGPLRMPGNWIRNLIFFFFPRHSFIRFIADNQMTDSCMLFVENYGSVIVEKNLCWNFLLHLVSMHDFGLLSTLTIDRAMARLRQCKPVVNNDSAEPVKEHAWNFRACPGSF